MGTPAAGRHVGQRLPVARWAMIAAAALVVALALMIIDPGARGAPGEALSRASARGEVAVGRPHAYHSTTSSCDRVVELRKRGRRCLDP